MKTLNLILLLFVYSCSGSKFSQTTTHKEKFATSFFSIGSGIDYKGKAAYDKFIEEFQKKESITLQVVKVKWGKEGEEDYCIDLKPVSAKQRDEFIQGAKQLLGSSTLVKIREVDTCNH